MNGIVIIIDKFVNRRDQLAQLFTKADAKVFTREMDGIKEWSKADNAWIKADIEIPEVDLMLIHGGDKNWKEDARFKKRIWYSGFDGRDSRAKSDEESIFMGLDDNGTKSLAVEDIGDLLSYAKGEIQETPKCLWAAHYEPKLEAVLELLQTISCKKSNEEENKLEIQIKNVEKELKEEVEPFIRKRLENNSITSLKAIREIRNHLFNKLLHA